MEAVITHSCNCMTYMVVLITITEKRTASMYHRHIKAVLSKLLNRLFYFSFLFFVPNMPLALHSFSLHPETRQVHNVLHDASLSAVSYALFLPWSAQKHGQDSSFCGFHPCCSNIQPLNLPDKLHQVLLSQYISDALHGCPRYLPVICTGSAIHLEMFHFYSGIFFHRCDDIIGLISNGF